MRVPLSWLAEYVAIDRDADSLAEGLTSLGLKVEAVHRPGAGIERVVVGEVLGIEQHPKAEKLILVDVRAGEGGDRRIVCGARNFSVGDRVPVALPGARLPGGMQIERASIAGEVSNGMLCSASELGLSDDHSGILVLAGSAAVGDDVRAVLGLDETVLEVEITPNRPDAMSLLGIAREVAALTGAEVRVPRVLLREGAVAAGSVAEVTVQDEAGCPRYLARVLLGVAPGPSPGGVQRRLTAAGIRPVSNVVDATNYALLVTGHPMHAFDLDRLEAGRIVVRRARAGERLVTIDGEERALDPDDLVIADASRPLALAGIMGGLQTEVSPATRNVLLESAHFDPKSVYRASKRHGLRTEASARFERGADPNDVPVAAGYCSALILEWAGGEAAAGAIDRYPVPAGPWTVSLRPERANLILGTSLEAEEMTGALERLGLEPAVEDGSIRVTVPTRRPDLTIEEDLVEEVARVVGYDRIPSRLPAGPNRAGALTREQQLTRQTRRILVGAGLSEAYSTSLVGPADLVRLGLPDGGVLRLDNPITADESMLRPSLLPGLAAAVARNVSRRNLAVRLFEIGVCFEATGELLPRELLRLGLVLHGPVEQQWHTPERELDFYDLKGAVEVLLDGLHVEGSSFAPVREEPLHPGRAAALSVSGRRLGVLGELSPAAAERYGFTHRALAAELDLAALFEAAAALPPAPEPARFPAALIDLAVAVSEEVPAGDLLATAREAGGELLETVRIFDVYRGEQVGAGRRSVAFSLSFRRADRTLTDDEALAARDAIAAAIARRHGGQIRR